MRLKIFDKHHLNIFCNLPETFSVIAWKLKLRVHQKQDQFKLAIIACDCIETFLIPFLLINCQQNIPPLQQFSCTAIKCIFVSTHMEQSTLQFETVWRVTQMYLGHLSTLNILSNS